MFHNPRFFFKKKTKFVSISASRGKPHSLSQLFAAPTDLKYAGNFEEVNKL